MNTTAAETNGRNRYDAVVVGGGAAGLSGALTLARARRSVLVIDSGAPRNAPAAGVHGFLGHDGIAPAQLLAAGRAEVLGYGGEIVDGEVATVRRSPEGVLRVVLGSGAEVFADRLLIATGLVDELPDVPALAERWGRDVVHCPYCHGWEVATRRIGVLATGPMAAEQALLWRQWSADVTLFRHTAPDLSDEEWEKLAARGIAVVDGEVTGLEVIDDRLTGVRLASGTVIERHVVVAAGRMVARADAFADLGVKVAELEMNGRIIGTYIPADPMGATEVPGVWVAGNATGLMEQVVGSAAAGVRAAAAINADLVAQETRRAVAERSEPFNARMEGEAAERVLGDGRHGM